MAARGIFGLISLILVAGAVLLEFFILLAGAINGSPVNKFYFLQVDTSNIQGAPELSRWTFWNVCDGSSGLNVCDKATSYGSIKPARPFDPPRNFGTDNNIPGEFIGTHFYYLMTRFMFAFMLISVFFSVIALFTGLLALCTRLGAYLSGALASIACLFQALTAALMTAAFIKGRNDFRGNNQAASVGRYAFGFEWAAFACLFIAMITFCVGGGSRKDSYGGAKKSRFGGRRSKSTRSRGSFITADKEFAST